MPIKKDKSNSLAKRLIIFGLIACLAVGIIMKELALQAGNWIYMLCECAAVTPLFIAVLMIFRSAKTKKAKIISGFFLFMFGSVYISCVVSLILQLFGVINP